VATRAENRKDARAKWEVAISSGQIRWTIPSETKTWRCIADGSMQVDILFVNIRDLDSELSARLILRSASSRDPSVERESLRFRDAATWLSMAAIDPLSRPGVNTMTARGYSSIVRDTTAVPRQSCLHG
jgi:hypothetical protein